MLSGGVSKPCGFRPNEQPHNNGSPEKKLAGFQGKVTPLE
jgi:hypothetical protein